MAGEAAMYVDDENFTLKTRNIAPLSLGITHRCARGREEREGQEMAAGVDQKVRGHLYQLNVMVCER